MLEGAFTGCEAHNRLWSFPQRDGKAYSYRSRKLMNSSKCLPIQWHVLCPFTGGNPQPPCGGTLTIFGENRRNVGDRHDNG